MLVHVVKLLIDISLTLKSKLEFDNFYLQLEVLSYQLVKPDKFERHVFFS